VAVAGYSKTPLSKKLGIKPGMRVAVLGAPDGYRDWLAPLPDDVTWTDSVTVDVDLVHLFMTEAERLGRQLSDCRQRLRPDAVIWASWPKKASKRPTDIIEGTIRELALPLGYVDVKVCAVSEIWSGLKLVVRRELR